MTQHSNHYPDQSPWAIPVAQVGSRPGQSFEIDQTFPAPSGIGDEFFGVAEGSDIEVNARFDSIVDGLIFSGTATARTTGECGRCLTDIDRDQTISLSTFMPYDADPTQTVTPGSKHEEVIVAGEEESAETHPLSAGGNFADIETLLRDGFTQEIPMTPLCKPDCRGLCPQCGLNLNDNPDHVHTVTDIRLSALEELKAQLETEGDETSA